MFTRLSLFQKVLLINRNRFKKKQQQLDADPKTIQQINFTRNLDRAEGACFSLLKKQKKKTVLDFLKGTITLL